MWRGPFGMAAFQNMIDIAAPTEAVFDFLVDAQNEPRWNPQMLHVQMLTAEPVGAGTRFRVKFGRGRRKCRDRGHEDRPPYSWTAVSRSRVLEAESEGQVLEFPGGSGLIIETRLRPVESSDR